MHTELKDRPRRRRRPGSSVRIQCIGCEGRGTVTAAELGVFGMVSDDGVAVPIPCLMCDGTGTAAPPEASRSRGRTT